MAADFAALLYWKDAGGILYLSVEKKTPWLLTRIHLGTSLFLSHTDRHTITREECVELLGSKWVSVFLSL